MPTPLAPHSLTARLESALRRGADAVSLLSGAEPLDERDRLSALLLIHDLHTAPLEQLGGAEWFQHHPVIATLKGELEGAFVERLSRLPRARDLGGTDESAVSAMRRIAAIDLVPPVYEWLADEASSTELVNFLAIEGGPDGGFDDLVAICQIGIDGPAKVTLAANYWDELGRGSLEHVHTELHRMLSRALALPRIAPAELPIEALARSALNGLLATNRARQPEMIGALGLLELQAGPRCRKVVQALRRLGAPSGAFPFYEEHASADPHHGKAWVDKAVGPLVDRHPDWGPRIVRGATWRSAVNDALFNALRAQFATAIAA